MEALRLEEQDWVLVGDAREIPPQGARVVVSPRGPIAIFRTLADQFYALLDRCPHKQGPLSEGIVHDCKVTCPLHNMDIALDTGEAVAPDEGQVPRFPVRIEDSQLYLRLTPLSPSETPPRRSRPWCGRSTGRPRGGLAWST